jgi:RNA recognition motif-containing protein
VKAAFQGDEVDSQQNQSNCTVYINNLAYKRDESGVNALCSKFGEVLSVKIIIDLVTKISKGMAFVEMKDVGAAKRVIKGLNGAVVDGRTLKAKYSTPQGSKINQKTLKDTFAEKKEITKPKKETLKKIKKDTAYKPKVEKNTGLNKLLNFLQSKKPST